MQLENEVGVASIAPSLQAPESDRSAVKFKSSPPLSFHDFLSIIRSFTTYNGGDEAGDHCARVGTTIHRIVMMLRERRRRPVMFRRKLHRSIDIPTSEQELVAMLEEHGLDTDGANFIWHDYENARSDLAYDQRQRCAE